MMDLVFLLEGESEKEMLHEFLPRFLPKDINPVLIPFEGKQDLLKRLNIKIKGWMKPCVGFVILCDKDHEDCILLKQKLQKACSSCGEGRYLIRIACAEIESWYLGDLFAVEKAFSLKNLGTYNKKKKYRAPDQLGNAKEELKKLTSKAYKEKSGSREIGKYLSPNPCDNSSCSFGVFLSGLKRFISPI